MAAVHSRRHSNVLLLLYMRELGHTNFRLDAVNSIGDSAAQMSTDPRCGDVILLMQTLDGAGIEAERRAALLRKGQTEGFSPTLMLTILVEAESQVTATTALLSAAQNTHRFQDAQATVSAVMIDVLDQIGPDHPALGAYMVSGQQEGVSFVRLLLKFELKEVLGHQAIQNAVLTEYFVGGIDLTSFNTAPIPNLWFFFYLISAFGLCPTSGPLWTLAYHLIAITCNFIPFAHRVVGAKLLEKAPLFVAFRCVQRMPLEFASKLAFAVLLTYTTYESWQLEDWTMRLSLFGLVSSLLHVVNRALFLGNFAGDDGHSRVPECAGLILVLLGLVTRLGALPLNTSERTDDGGQFTPDSGLLALGLGLFWGDESWQHTPKF